MAAQFKLVFNGKALPDHHPAVVRGRLQKLLKTTDEQAEMLFSGKPVVVKKLTDEATMQRYSKAFTNAGAVLEVVRLSVVTEAASARFSGFEIGCGWQ